MQTQRVGVAVDDFGLPVKDGLQRAAHLGFRAVEIGATTGDVQPEQLSESGRRHLVRYLNNLGLAGAALSAEPGGPGLADPGVVDARVNQTRKIIELAAELGFRVVTAEVGRLVDPETDEILPIARDALQALGNHADRVGTFLAIQTGVDAPGKLYDALAAICSPSLQVCLDPAQLARSGHDPVAAIGPLANEIALSHFGDATLGGPASPGLETALGRGSIDLAALVAGLSDAGYSGPLILRRRDAHDPIRDLAAGIELVKSILS